MKKKIILVIILIVLFIIIMNRCSQINYIYKENWGLDIPNPYKTETLINEGIKDFSRFSLMYYSEDDVKDLKNKKFMKKINTDKLNQIYIDIISKYFLNFLNEKDKKLFNQVFNKNDLFNENNYYILLEKGKLEEVGYCFELLLLDTNKNIIYSIVSTS